MFHDEVFDPSTFTITNETWDGESFINILGEFMKDKDSTILYLDYSCGCSSETMKLMKLFVNNIVETKLEFDNDKEKHIIIITKPTHNGSIEPDAYSPIYRPNDKYGNIKPKTNRELFSELINSFCSSADGLINIDISALPKEIAKNVILNYNLNRKDPLIIKFPNNCKAHIYKKSYSNKYKIYSKGYQPEPHLYKLGEKYPYKPIPPTTVSNAVKTKGEIAWEKAMEEMRSIVCADQPHYNRVVGYMNTLLKKPVPGTSIPNPVCNYHFTYKYSNIEKHDKPTPPWYKQDIDICNEFMKLVKTKLNNFINSDDTNIYVQYQDNTFVIEIFINKLPCELKSKIDNALAIPVLAIHRWGGLYLTHAEIKEYTIPYECN